MERLKSFLTYENISLTVQALMMVATFMAAFIALHQLKLSQRKKLKLSINYQILIVNNEQYPNCIELKATNIGNRIIEIISWGIDAKNNKQLQIMDCNGIKNDLPYKLQLDETKMLLYPLGLLKQALNKYVNEGLLNANSKLKLYIKDSTGDIYYCKAKEKIIKFIESNL